MESGQVLRPKFESRVQAPPPPSSELSHSHTSPEPEMPFKRYVEIGRVALVNYGEDYGKLVVIVDVLDQNRALVDSPDMVRSQMNFKRLSLTDIKIDIKRVPKKKELLAAMEAADVKKKWENSSWGRKLIVQKRRASLNDFDRFKLMLAKIKSSPSGQKCIHQDRIFSSRLASIDGFHNLLRHPSKVASALLLILLVK
ncbi:unnamed protein product [Prunus brigantina]